MKVYRILGTIVSSLLSIVLIVSLLSSLLVLGATNAIREDTVSDITTELMEESPLADELFNELSDVFASEFADMLSSSAVVGGEGNELTVITEEDIKKITETEEFQSTLRDIISEYATALLTKQDVNTISCADRFSAMFVENTEVFDLIIAEILNKNGISEELFYEAIAMYAGASASSMPEKGASDSKLIAFVVSLNKNKIDTTVSAQIPTKEDIAEIVTESVLENAALSKKITAEFSKMIAVSVTVGAQTITLITDDDVINITSTAEYNDTLTQTVTEYVEMIVGIREDNSVDCAENFENMVLDNPEIFNDWMSAIVSKKGLTYDLAYLALKTHFESKGVKIPPNGCSYAEIIASVIAANGEIINNAAASRVPSTEDLVSLATDYLTADDSITKNIEAGFSEAFTFRTTSTSFTEAEIITEEDMQELLSFPAFRHTLSEFITDYVLMILGQNALTAISFAERFEAMFLNHQDTFNGWIEDKLQKNDISYDLFYEAIDMVIEGELPAKGASYSEIFASMIAANGESIDGIISEYIPLSIENEEELPAEMAELRNTITMVSDTLALLQNPVLYVAIAGIVIIFFLLFALLTWSFKIPSMITGIATILAGAPLLLIATASVPFEAIIESLALNDPAMKQTVAGLATTIWASIASNLLITAVVCICAGVLLIGLFILLQILSSKKRKAQSSAEMRAIAEVPASAEAEIE